MHSPDSQIDSPSTMLASNISEPVTTPIKNKEKLWGGVLAQHDAVNFEGSERKRLALNNGLARAWERGRAIPWILARVRCEILKLTTTEYSKQLGIIPPQRLHGMERPPLAAIPKPERRDFTILIQDWKKRASMTKDTALQKQLLSASKELLRTLNTRYGKTIPGLLAQWRDETGKEVFEVKTGYDIKSLNTLYTTGVLPSFNRLIQIARDIALIPANLSGEQLWDNAYIKELRETWLHEAKSRERQLLVVELEMRLGCCGIPWNQIYNVDKMGFPLSRRASGLLIKYDLVPWKFVAPLVEYLRTKNFFSIQEQSQFRSNWLQALNDREESFESAIFRIFKERKIKIEKVAAQLGYLKAGVSQPRRVLMRQLKFRSASKIAPPATLALLAARNEMEKQHLLQLKCRNIILDQIRKGSALVGRLFAVRRAWGLTRNEICIEGVTEREIFRLEKGSTDANSRRMIARLITHTESVGRKKFAAILGLPIPQITKVLPSQTASTHQPLKAHAKRREKPAQAELLRKIRISEDEVESILNRNGGEDLYSFHGALAMRVNALEKPGMKSIEQLVIAEAAKLRKELSKPKPKPGKRSGSGLLRQS